MFVGRWFHVGKPGGLLWGNPNDSKVIFQKCEQKFCLRVVSHALHLLAPLTITMLVPGLLYIKLFFLLFIAFP